MMKITINTRIMKSCFFSSISFITWPLSKSRVKVELDARTSDERVDIEADNTRMTTTPINMSGRFESITGITAS